MLTMNEEKNNWMPIMISVAPGSAIRRSASSPKPHDPGGEYDDLYGHASQDDRGSEPESVLEPWLCLDAVKPWDRARS
jgi:hypothetical protein